MGRGSAFMRHDFLDLGNIDAVAKVLTRLSSDKIIRRLKPGLFDFPRFNRKLGGELSPDLDQLAKAIARKNGLRIQVTGAQAANLLGLSTQVPAQAIYLTDGPSKRIKIGNREIVFRHVEPRRIRMSKSKSGIVMEALKYFGQDGLNNKIIDTLRRELTGREKRQMLKDADKAPAWLGKVIRQITGEAA
ncbi:MAG TPA: hypothetical protein DCZ94_05920 [Lentisphaeria bacterium]|nr:hypothetical protein [Lentisphaeria bacterium]